MLTPASFGEDDSLYFNDVLRTREGLQGQVGGGLHHELAAVEGK